MANRDYSHTAELMKASLPYFDGRTRPQVELFSKVLDLMGSLNSLAGRGGIVAFGYSAEPVSIDMEGLLNGIRPLCDQNERKFVDQILNIFNIKRIFEMYNGFMDMMNVMQGAGGFSFSEEGNPGEAHPEEGSKEDVENVTGNFTGSNYDSIFPGYDNVAGMPYEEGNSNGNQENMFFYNNGEEANPYNHNEGILYDYSKDIPYDHDEDVPHDHNEGVPHDYPRAEAASVDSGKYAAGEYVGADNSGNAQIGGNRNAKAGNSGNARVEGNGNAASASGNAKAGGNAAFKIDSSMFDMFKGMVPPEQMSTFENLRMLFNAMSYDNNNKPNDGKEHEYG